MLPASRSRGAQKRSLGGAADEEDGADGAVWLFLLEGGAEAVAAGVTVQAEGAGIVSHGAPVGKYQDRRLGAVVKGLTGVSPMTGVKLNLTQRS